MWDLGLVRNLSTHLINTKLHKNMHIKFAHILDRSLKDLFLKDGG